MKRHLMCGLAAAVALAGCGGGASNRAGTSANTVNDAGGTPVALVGCLVPGAAGVGSGTVGTAGNTAANGFTLIDVTTTSTPASDTGTGSGVSGTQGSSRTSGTSGKSGIAVVDTGTPRSYSLIAGKAQDDLQKYQNSRVEVTGVAVASTDTGLGVPDVGAASAPAGTPPTAVQRVRVDHVRQIDKSCSGTNQSR